MKTILDVCCGGRCFWFDKNNPAAVYVDRRIEHVKMKHKKEKDGFLHLDIRPDIQADFTCLPFRDGAFELVVFDPPHLFDRGNNSWLMKRYGRLPDDWEFMISEGFFECFRVLSDSGVLIFKWSKTDVPISRVINLTKLKPIFGHKSGKQNNTHWVCFKKDRAKKEDMENIQNNRQQPHV